MKTPAKEQVKKLLCPQAGTLVRHAFFGEGTVLSCSAPTRPGQEQEITIDFGGNLGIKKFLLSLTPIEVVKRK